MRVDQQQMSRYMLDIDLRLIGAWDALGKRPEMDILQEDNIEILSQAMRMAYERGYIDALREDNRDERAKMFLDNRFAPPKGVL